MVLLLIVLGPEYWMKKQSKPRERRAPLIFPMDADKQVRSLPVAPDANLDAPQGFASEARLVRTD
jgi:hypothetical protein